MSVYIRTWVFVSLMLVVQGREIVSWYISVTCLCCGQTAACAAPEEIHGWLCSVAGAAQLVQPCIQHLAGALPARHGA